MKSSSAYMSVMGSGKKPASLQYGLILTELKKNKTLKASKS